MTLLKRNKWGAHNLFYMGISCLLILLGVLSVILYKNATKLEQLENNRFKLYSLGNELKDGSDDLTTYCRTYVLTGDSIWEQKYWDLLAIRNGKKTRPDGHTISLRDSLLKLGIAPNEFEQLQLAEKNSNELVWTENVAFHAMKGFFPDSLKQFKVRSVPDTMLARKIMFDKKYFEAKEKIMFPIANFRLLLDKRIISSVKNQKAKNNALLVIIGILILLISILSYYAIFILRRKILQQVKELENQNVRIRKSGEELLEQNKNLDTKIQERNKELNAKYQELIKSQDEIKQRESELKAFFDNVDGAASILDTDKRYLYFNQKQIETYTTLVSRPPVIGGKVYDHFPEHVTTERYKLLDEVLKGNKKTIDVEYVRNGKLISFNTSFTPITINGKVAGIATYSVDLSESREAQKVIEKNEEWLRALVNNISDAITVISGDTPPQIIYRSPSVERINGYSADDIKDKSVLDLIHSEDRQRCTGFFQQAYANPGIPFTDEFRMICRNGQTIWIEATITNLLNNQSVHGIVINYQDITARKLDALKLKQSEEKNRAVIENISDAIFLMNEETISSYHSPSVQHIFGYTFEETQGKTVFHFIHPDELEDARKFFSDVIIKPGISFQSQFRVRHKNGRYIWVEGTATNLLDNESIKAIILNCRDITERKNAEMEIESLNESLEKKVVERTVQLKEANKELESFSYSVSHDLRTPLTIIHGYAQVLLQEDAKMDKDTRTMLQAVMQNAEKMADLIDDILALSSAVKTEAKITNLDMAELAKKAYAELEKSLNNTEKVKITFSQLLPCYADNNLIMQVFTNLISNAIKYSGRKENPEIEVGSYQKNDECIYYVKDNGAGFDMKNYDKLFGVFKRLHSSKEFEGTGVGLALVKRIITKHNGKVWAEAKPNEGATFYFSLPIKTY